MSYSALINNSMDFWRPFQQTIAFQILITYQAVTTPSHPSRPINPINPIFLKLSYIVLYFDYLSYKSYIMTV